MLQRHTVMTHGLAIASSNPGQQTQLIKQGEQWPSNGKKPRKHRKRKWHGQCPPVTKPVYLTYEEVIEIARDRESGLVAEQVKAGHDRQDIVNINCQY